MSDSAAPSGTIAIDIGAEPACNLPASPVPPPSERHALLAMTGAAAARARLLVAHGALVQALCARSPADFRPLPTLASSRHGVIVEAFTAASPVPASVASTLAPLVAPRLERVVTTLRRRLARERTLIALRSVTEMDPTCLRRNARLPGRTLIEKAGPKQRLVAVRRVARFDTMENRVLRRAAVQLGGAAEESLTRIPADLDRALPQRRALRRLKAACDAVVARPELEGIGEPRPGERPSNALLGDADYRAAWRALQFLRREEERFVGEWLAIEAVWSEMLMMAVWAALDSTPGVEPLPAALVVDDIRQIWRIGRGGARRWLMWRASGPIRIEARLPEVPGGAIDLRVGGERVTWPTALVLVDDAAGDQLLDATTGEEPTARLAAARAHALVATLMSMACEDADPATWTPSKLRTSEQREQGQVACAMDGRLGLCGGLDLWHGEPTGAAALEVALPAIGLDLAEPEATAATEAPLLVTGREATWLPQVCGPHSLHRERADLLGELLDPLLPASERAVIVPDCFGALSASLLHRRMGRVWLVWAPVAVALTVTDPPPLGCTLGVVVLTDAALDVAVLEWREDPTAPGAPFWVRSPPLRGDVSGREGRQFPESNEARGGWLRRPADPDGWVVDAAGPRRVVVPEGAEFATVAADRLERWRGDKPPNRILVVGFGDGDLAALRVLLLDRQVEALPTSTLLRGGQRFLELRALKRPTWKDRLPALDLRVASGRERKKVTIIPKGSALVAPGDSVRFTTEQSFDIAAEKDTISLPLWQEDAVADYVFRVRGPPLPLERACRVRIEISWTYGMSGMKGALRPTGSASFTSLPFDLVAPEVPADNAETEQSSRQFGAPTLTRPNPMSQEAVRQIETTADAVLHAWGQIQGAKRRQAVGQPGWWDAQLRTVMEPLRDSLKGVSLPDLAAQRVLNRVVDLAEWLLGLPGLKGAGPPPALSKDTRLLVVRCRSLTGQRGNGRFVETVLADASIPNSERLAAVAGVIDGRPDATWQVLVGWNPRQASEVAEWGRALTRAMMDSPDLAEALPEADATRLIEAAIDRMEGMIPVAADKSGPSVYWLSGVIRWTLEIRHHAKLPPWKPEVIDLATRLQSVLDRLPPAAKTYTPTRVGQPLVPGGDKRLGTDVYVAAVPDWLLGRYDSLLSEGNS